jgi:hypothetical protein
MQDEVGINAPRSGSPWRRLLLWELAWLSVEVTVVALGLYLMQGLKWDAVGGLALLGFLGLDFAVRWRHYAALRMQDKGGETRR